VQAEHHDAGHHPHQLREEDRSRDLEKAPFSTGHQTNCGNNEGIETAHHSRERKGC
jgi:hypothetical protein